MSQECDECIGFVPESNSGVCSIRGCECNRYSTCERFTRHHGEESDPTGRKPNDPGAKLDQGKNRLGLVMFGFARALQEVGKVGTYGAQKYSDNGWMEVPDGKRRYTDAMFRHLMKEAAGEEIDPDTQLLHAAQTAWNSLSRLELMLREKEAKESK